jgi:type 1 fimbriae regulatory protein FimB
MKNIGNRKPLTPPVGQSAQTVQPNPLPTKKPKKRRRSELDDTMYLEPHEVTALFDHIVTKRDRAIFRLAYHRGLRAHEVGLLQLADFRDRDGVLYVRRGKGSVSRDHTLIREELLAVRAWIKERGKEPGPLFPSRQGARGITRTRLDQLMKSYCRMAGIRAEKAHMHALKHSCGTHLSERGNTADAIQDWLGHRDSKSTDIYMHFTARRRREMTDKNRDWV